MLKFIFLFLFLFLNFNNNVIAGGGIIAPSSGNVITGVVRPDYNDIRFGRADGRMLSFWREEVSGDKSYWWILTDFPIFTGLNRIYYIYYDNLTQGVNYSDGSVVFPLFFDDFRDTSLSKWVITATSNRPFVEAGQLCILAGSNVCGNLEGRCLGVMYSRFTTYRVENLVLDFDIMRFSQSPYNGYAKVGWQQPFYREKHHYIGLGSDLDTNHFNILLYAGMPGNNFKRQTGLQTNFPPMFLHKFSFREDVVNGVPTLHFGTPENPIMMSLTTNMAYILFQSSAISIGEDMRAGKFYIDNIRVRLKPYQPEPTITYGQEEVGNWNGYTKRRQITINNPTSFTYRNGFQFRIPVKIQTIQPSLRVIGGS